MKKAQFTSPVIILSIIILSTLIILVQTNLNNKMQQNSIIQNKIVSDITSLEELDTNYKILLTKQVLTLLSTINSSGTINNILLNQNVTNIEFNNEIKVDYNTFHELEGNRIERNGTIIVPYKYNSFLNQEQRFNLESFKDCVGTGRCAQAVNCANDYDQDEFNWELKLCLTNPLRVKIGIENSLNSLTKDYSYTIFNNSHIVLD